MSNPKCARFSDSIDPITVPRSNEEIKKVLDCLKKDAFLYLRSIEDSKSFISHFRKSILPRLERNQLLEKFLSEVDKYASAELVRTTFVASNFARIVEKTHDDIEWWMEKYGIKARIKRNKSEIQGQDDLVDLMKIAYGDFVHLSVLLSQMFFALEFSCKMLCSFGCYRFALKVTKAKVIQHKEIWKQLKILGSKEGIDCDTCLGRESCNFKVDFASLARVYAYSMKVRQLVDYTTKLASLDIFKSGLINPPFVYFSSITNIVERNLFLGKECLPKHYLPKVAARFIVLERERRKLYGPFSWDEKELKRFVAERPGDGLAWYFLGRLYFKRDDTTNAIECMEKAKKLDSQNPDVWHSLGILYDVTGRTLKDELKALRHLEKAKEIAPQNCETLLLTGFMHLALGNLVLAVEELENAGGLATKTDDLVAINQGLYEAYKRVNEFAKAEKSLEKARQLSPQYQMKFKGFLEEFLRERKKFARILK